MKAPTDNKNYVKCNLSSTFKSGDMLPTKHTPLPEYP